MPQKLLSAEDPAAHEKKKKFPFALKAGTIIAGQCVIVL